MKPGSIHQIEALVPLGGEDARDLVLVLHDDSALLYESATVLVVPLIALPASMHGHALVKIVPTPQNGLTQPVAGALDRLHGVDRARIGDPLGELDRSTMIDIYRMLDRLIGRTPAKQSPSHSGDTLHTEL